jgi:hypothetical protein
MGPHQKQLGSAKVGKEVVHRKQKKELRHRSLEIAEVSNKKQFAGALKCNAKSRRNEANDRQNSKPVFGNK